MNRIKWLACVASPSDIGAIEPRTGVTNNNTFYLCCTLLVLLLTAGWQLNQGALAQTEPQAVTEQASLEQKYRDELDKWMLRAYEGDRDAQFKVGVLFTNDQFGPPDFEQAVYWYKQAARQGHVLAQYNLGHQYLTGVGVHKNEQLAMQWWLEAAKQDHALAQFNVGRAYYLGIGLFENHEQSKYWFERAAYNQEPKSIEILQQLGWYDGDLAAPPAAPPGVTLTPENIAENAGPVSVEGETQPATPQPPLLASKITPISPTTGATGAATAGATKPPTANVVEPSPTVAPTPQTVKTSSLGTNNPIALYTNPQVRSVLITILEDRNEISVVKRRATWTTVTTQKGFPVWVHKDFLAVNGKQGTVTGQAVNARSVPIITNGTVVGKLNKNETVRVVDERQNWIRVIAPLRFTAWVKTADLDQPAAVAAAPNSAAANTGGAVSNPQATSARSANDNEWLFQQPANNFTLQLASFDDPEKIRTFESRAKFRNNPELHRFTAKGKNIDWTYFLYGSYASSKAAEAAKQQIGQKLAWVRTFGRLQQNRCVAWKTQLPTPPELNRYCTQAAAQ